MISLNREARAFSNRLVECRMVSRTLFRNVWQEAFDSGRTLVVGQQDYARVHRQRFFELFNAVALLTEGQRRPRLLEFGVSEFSAFYRKLFPHLRLDLSDRPTPPGYPGFTAEIARAISGCENYYAIDLEDPQSLVACDGLKRQRYDVIVCAEVIEHLVVNPVELLAALLKYLKPHGTLYLTTPNFFSWKNRILLEKGENPQEVYPEAGGNWDAHYHHREYGARELQRFIVEAGGRVTGFALSDCLDVGIVARRRIAACPDERGNIVFTVQRAAKRWRRN